MRGASSRRTICEVLRECADLSQDRPEVLARLAEASAMAKRMDSRLFEYSREWDRDFWEANPDEARDLERRLRADYVSIDVDDGRVPSQGGRELGPVLRELAADVRPGRSVVELGPWLGAGTREILAGLGDRPVVVRVYDRFRASESEVRKAARFGTLLTVGQDVLPVFLASIEQDHRVRASRLDLPPVSRQDGEPIGLYVDDVCKREAAFLGCLRSFGPSFVPGETAIVLMDYWYWEKRPADLGLRFQADWISRHRESFRTVRARVPGLSAAIFRYEGGEPWRE